MAPSSVCRICGNQHDNNRFVVREMLYGTKEEFTYFECGTCNTLQIMEIPENLFTYYPSSYLGDPSKQAAGEPTKPLRTFLRQQRVMYLLYGKSVLGKAVSQLGKDYFPYEWDWFRSGGVTPNSHILDVGCGPGMLLNALQEQGFSKLTGLDPFQESTLAGVDIKRCQLSDLTGTYDFIMSHHSFEHMPDPIQALESMKRLCRPSGKILIRIPVANCCAWKTYGVNWYQIDAPRHLVIPSVAGMETLAKRVGLILYKIEFDSNETQFLCSEQYKQDIPLKDERSYFRTYHGGVAPTFSSEEIKQFQLKSEEVNKLGEGDQACFYFENSL